MPIALLQTVCASRPAAALRNSSALLSSIELLFVPILQHQELGESTKEDFRFVATEQARLRENDFGIVIDRLRLTEFMASSKTDGRYETAEYAQHEATTLAWFEAAADYASGADTAAA